MNELKTRLVPIRNRMRLRNSWLSIQRMIWLPAAAGLAVQIVGRFFPIQQLWAWTLLPMGVWIASQASYHMLKPLSLDQTARQMDLELSLKERISTSLAFMPSQNNSLSQNLLLRQRSDALDHLRSINPRQAFPFLWLKKPMLVGALLLSVAFLSGILPNPMTALLRERTEIRQAVQEQAARVEKLREDAAINQELTPESREQLIKELDELAKALKQNRGDLEQAIADLNRFEAQARLSLDPELGAQQALQEAIAQQLARMAGESPTSSIPDNPQQALEELMKQVESMDETEREKLARELAKLAAQAAQAGDLHASQALSGLAQSLQESDLSAAQAAAKNLKAAMSQLDQNLTNQAAIQGLLDQTQASQQALVQAGRAAAQHSGRQQAAGSGQDAGQSPGQTAGQNPGQSTGQGQPSGGGGSKANTLPPATGGRTTLRSPQGEAANAVEGLLNQSIYAPWQRSEDNGDPLFIPGQDSGQGQTSTIEGQGQNPGMYNPALVPYYQVFPQYLSAANQAMESSYIPGDLVDYVRQYFSSLEPK